MTWQTIAEFTLSDIWQYTAPLNGRLFRVRHLSNPPNARGLISQAVLDDPALELFDIQRLVPKQQNDLLDLLTPPGLDNYRRIAVKLAAYSSQSWRIAIDAFEPVNPTAQASLLATLQALIATKADAAAVDLQPINTALADKIGATQFQQAIANLTQAINAQIDPTELATALQPINTALADKIGATQFQQAIANLTQAINAQIDPSELADTLQSLIIPQQIIRQSEVFKFETIYSTNSLSYTALGVSAALSKPLKSLSSKVRIRFDGRAGISSNGPTALFSLGRGSTLLHSPTLAGLTQCRNQDPSAVSFVFQDSPGTLTPEYSLWARLTAAATVYLNRPGSVSTPLTASYLTLEEII